MDLKNWIRSVNDFPSAGIVFRDITPLLRHPPALRYAVNYFTDTLSALSIDCICVVDSRGFLFGSPIGIRLDLPIVLLRKGGKLPPPVIKQEYKLEYASATIEIGEKVLSPGLRVAIIDDLLATGGTARAGEILVEKAGAKPIADVFLVELTDLKGRQNLQSQHVISLVKY